MKNLLVIISLLATQAAFAQISNSQNNPRHQAVMVAAIQNNCGYMRDLTQVSQTEEIVRVDNGIQDVRYVTVLSGLQRMDQNIFDQYEITVLSEYADMYDHTAQDWGAYFATTVTCVMK
ncbi:MAG: hypothetical protein ABL930_04710 [Pseudobdellovibrio sp.]